MLIQDLALVSSEHLPFWWRLGNAAVTYVMYLGQFFYPVGLIAIYPRPGLDLPWWEIGAACLVLASITVAAFLGRRRWPYLLVGWLWYLGMLAPVIGLLQVGCTSMADRFTYLSQIGLAVALVWGVADLCRVWSYRRWACGAASAAVLALLMGCAFRQTAFWCDSETLWTRALAVTSENSMAHNGMGQALATEGRLAEAIGHFRRATTISPYVALFAQPGQCLDCGGPVRRGDRAVPQGPGARSRLRRAHDRLGVLLADRGRLDEAMAHFRRSLEAGTPTIPTPATTLARSSGGVAGKTRRKTVSQGRGNRPRLCGGSQQSRLAMADRGRWNEAIKHFERALDGDPKCRSARANLGRALAACGRYEDAIAQYRTVLRLDPNDPEARDQLSQLTARERTHNAAVPSSVGYASAERAPVFLAAAKPRYAEA